MRLYKFGKELGWRMAVTPDPTGGNLPREAPPWVPMGAVDVPEDEPPGRIGASAPEILRGVAKDGYFILQLGDETYT